VLQLHLFAAFSSISDWQTSLPTVDFRFFHFFSFNFESFLISLFISLVDGRCSGYTIPVALHAHLRNLRTVIRGSNLSTRHVICIRITSAFQCDHALTHLPSLHTSRLIFCIGFHFVCELNGSFPRQSPFRALNMLLGSISNICSTLPSLPVSPLFFLFICVCIALFRSLIVRSFCGHSNYPKVLSLSLSLSLSYRFLRLPVQSLILPFTCFVYSAFSYRTFQIKILGLTLIR
jgi:hypothetical protein